MDKVAFAVLAFLFAAALFSSWNVASLERSNHEAVLKELGALSESVAALQQKQDATAKHLQKLEAKQKRVALLNAFLPVPGLGKIRFSAEVPTDDIKKVLDYTQGMDAIWAKVLPEE